jgi:acetyl esterase/lipase
MSFDDLPPLPKPIHPEAVGYAERCMTATRNVQARHRVAIDRAYGSDYWQKLDVYVPDMSRGGMPILLFFHGGAWTSGTKEWMGFMAPPLLSVPAVFATANYRLAPACRYPGPLEDCVDALAWIHRHAVEFGGDPGRIFVGGHSAGGHLGALTALRRDLWAQRGLPDGVVRGCFAISGSFDLRSRDAEPGSPQRRIYDVFLSRDEDDENASPISLVDEKAVPFHIAWGERDFPRLIDQAKAMEAALSRFGRSVETLEIPGRDHFGANEICADTDSVWIAAVRRWLDASQAAASKEG